MRSASEFLEELALHVVSGTKRTPLARGAKTVVTGEIFERATLAVRRVKKGSPATHPILGDELRACVGSSGSKSPSVFTLERGSLFTTAGFAWMLQRAGEGCRILLQLWWLPLSPVLDARRHVLADQDLLQPFATRGHLGLDDDLDPLRMRAELLARTRRSLRSDCRGRFRSASTAATPVAISSNTKAVRRSACGYASVPSACRTACAQASYYVFRHFAYLNGRTHRSRESLPLSPETAQRGARFAKT
jgi:hypothetical protein